MFGIGRDIGINLMAEAPTVVKISGHCLDRADLLCQFADIVARSEEELIIVHGGGKEISQLQRKLDIRPRYVDGLRITDGDSLALVEMVLCGSVNKTAGASFAGGRRRCPGFVRRRSRLGPGAPDAA